MWPKRRAPAIGMLALIACGGSGTEPIGEEISFGDCIPSAPTSATLDDLSVTLEARPDTVTYVDLMEMRLTYDYAGSEFLDVGPFEECLEEFSVRGERDIGWSQCMADRRSLLPGASQIHSVSTGFRPVGVGSERCSRDGFYEPRNCGLMAPPATYCVVARVSNGSDSVVVEAKFVLIED